MLIDNYRHIHIYENAFSQFFDRRDVTYFLAVYKGAEPGQPGPSQKKLIFPYKSIRYRFNFQEN